MSECLFCSIAAGDIEADVVYEDDKVIGFRDINPQAPVHILVIPRRHHADLNELESADAELTAHLFSVVPEIAREEEVDEDGYRVVINNGADAGQEVEHLHVHILAGRGLGWPPG